MTGTSRPWYESLENEPTGSAVIGPAPLEDPRRLLAARVTDEEGVLVPHDLPSPSKPMSERVAVPAPRVLGVHRRTRGQQARREIELERVYRCGMYAHCVARVGRVGRPRIWDAGPARVPATRATRTRARQGSL
jgi:hypothetical protein